MDIGVVLQTTPPSARVVDLGTKAETYGFTHVWTFDSHILWQEPFVDLHQILAKTRKVIVGSMVTNPATRDWTVTASVFATLNEMFGNRTVIGIGRGDSAVRVTNGKPTTLATLRESVNVIRELANGRTAEYKGSKIRFPWASRSRAGGVGRGLRPEGAQADRRGRRRVHPAARRPAHHRVDDRRRPRGRRARPAAIPTTSRSASPRRPTSTDGRLAHARDQCRWFGGMVGNHVADIVARYGETSAVPKALTDYIKGREGYDYNEHGQAGNVHTEFVPDEIVDRFCILGPVEEHVASPGGAEEPGRRPVRRLPAARRQGRDPPGLRREGHPGHRRHGPREDVTRVRRIWTFAARRWCSSRSSGRSTSGSGRRTAAPSSAGRSCPARTTRRCRTCGRCSRRYARARASGLEHLDLRGRAHRRMVHVPARARRASCSGRSSGSVWRS